MTSLAALKREITEVKATVDKSFNPQSVAIIFPFSSPNEPHGVFCFQQIYVSGPKQGLKAGLDYDSEIETLTEDYKKYDDGTDHGKRIVGAGNFLSHYPTFDVYLAFRRCNCGRHGPDGKQPYSGDNPA